MEELKEDSQWGNPVGKFDLKPTSCDVMWEEKKSGLFRCWRRYFIPGRDGLCTSANL